MVIGNKFIWTHIGRTGGYSLDKMFRILNEPDIVLDPLGGKWSGWKRHQTFAMRERELGQNLTSTRLKLMSIRRLPAWLLSFAEYKQNRQGIPFSRKDLIAGILKTEFRDVETGFMDYSRLRTFHVDEILNYYNFRQIDQWFRTEYLAEDFIRIMEQFYDISEEKKDRIRSVRENSNEYDRELSKRFSAEEIEAMYANCPVWATLEVELYGRHHH